MVIDLLAGPFVEFAFMRRALVAVVALALGAAPLGALLTLRRLSLVGDALRHAVLPGVALGFMFFGLSLTALSIGGVLAGMLVVLAAALVSRHTRLAEDASLAALYLVALALGVMLISLQGSQIDLLHILFGNVLGVDRDALLLVAGVASATLLLLALMYRGLLIESFDSAFLAAGQGGRAWFQQLFLMLVVVNGLGFEGWQQRLVQAAGYQGEVLVASMGVQPRGHVHDHEDHQGHDHGHLDPHAWQDPRNVMRYVANIATALARADPAGAAVYRAKAASYQVLLRELDAWAGARFAGIPVDQRRAVTVHAAFGYLAARYGLRLTALQALQALSTNSEAGARAMGELVRRLRADGTLAVFAENLHNARLLRQLAGEAGLAVGGKLYSDALSGPRGPAPTYLALMRYNVDQLARGMQGKRR